MGSATCYGDSFTLLCVHDVHTSKESHLWASTACYGDSFTSFYLDYKAVLSVEGQPTTEATRH
jgi:hypothetical protein